MQVTYKRLQATLQALGSNAEAPQPGAGLAELIFSVRPPRFAPQPPAWKALNTGLDNNSEPSTVDKRAASHRSGSRQLRSVEQGLLFEC